MTVPLLEALHKRFPKARITYVLGGAAHPLFKDGIKVLNNNPHVDRCIKSDRFILHKILKDKPFDLCIDLCGGKVSNLISRLSGAKINIRGRFRQRPADFFYSYYTKQGGLKTFRFSIPKGLTRVACFMSILDKIGMPASGLIAPRIYLSSREKEYSVRFLKKIKKTNKVVFGIHPGGRFKSRLWGVKNYGMLANMLVKELSAEVIVFHGPGEEFYVNSVCEAATERLRKVFKNDIRKHLAILSGCDFFISSDGGPLHMALSLGVPSIGLFKNKKVMRYWFDAYKQTGCLNHFFIHENKTKEAEKVFEKVKHILKDRHMAV